MTAKAKMTTTIAWTQTGKEISSLEEYLEGRHSNSKKERDAFTVLYVPESILRRNAQTRVIASLNNSTILERILRRPLTFSKQGPIMIVERIKAEVIIEIVEAMEETQEKSTIGMTAMIDMTQEMIQEMKIGPMKETRTEVVTVDTLTKASLMLTNLNINHGVKTLRNNQILLQLTATITIKTRITINNKRHRIIITIIILTTTDQIWIFAISIILTLALHHTITETLGVATTIIEGCPTSPVSAA